MSYYTRVIVSHGSTDLGRIGPYLDRPMDGNSDQRLSQVDADPAGYEYGASVWEADFNRLSWDAFAWWIAHLPWERPEAVQVFSRGEQDDRFSVWRIVDRTLVCVLPGDD